MPEEQESEELDLLSDTQEPTMETGSLEFSDDVTSPRGTSTTLAGKLFPLLIISTHEKLCSY